MLAATTTQRSLAAGAARRLALALALACLAASACGSDDPVAAEGGGREPKATTSTKVVSRDSGRPSADGQVAAAAAAADEAIDPRVRKAVDLADRIDADPAKADDILQAADMDRDALSDLFYEIAADPALSQAYEAARSA